MDPELMKRIWQAAYDCYHSDDINIDTPCDKDVEDTFSQADGGTWVRAWVWVADEEVS
jgi:hypothetical protein